MYHKVLGLELPCLGEDEDGSEEAPGHLRCWTGQSLGQSRYHGCLRKEKGRPISLYMLLTAGGISPTSLLPAHAVARLSTIPKEGRGVRSRRGEAGSEMRSWADEVSDSFKCRRAELSCRCRHWS
jgi:hypothetical protein